jgi:hypothetical protein
MYILYTFRCINVCIFVLINSCLMFIVLLLYKYVHVYIRTGKYLYPSGNFVARGDNNHSTPGSADNTSSNYYQKSNHPPIPHHPFYPPPPLNLHITPTQVWDIVHQQLILARPGENSLSLAASRH